MRLRNQFNMSCNRIVAKITRLRPVTYKETFSTGPQRRCIYLSYKVGHAAIDSEQRVLVFTCAFKPTTPTPSIAIENKLASGNPVAMRVPDRW